MNVHAKIRAALVAGLFFLSFGGLLLHYVVHDPAKYTYSVVPLAVGVVASLVTPWLFLSRRTIHLGYLLTGFAAIIGTVTMGHYALVKRPIWPDLFILWPKFLMGYALFHLEMFPLDAAHKPGKNWVRYPHLGFWLVHLVMLSAVYAAGALLWR